MNTPMKWYWSSDAANMGSSHAMAYHADPGFELAGVVDQVAGPRRTLAAALGGVAEFDDYERALAATRPDCVAVCTYPDTHAGLTLRAFAPAATCSSRSRWRPAWRRPSRWWPRRRGPGASSWSATSSGTIRPG